MPNLNDFRNFVLQQRPDLSSSQLGELDSFIQQQQAREIAGKGVPLESIQTDPTLRGIQYEQSLQPGFEAIPIKPEEQQARQQAGETVKVVLGEFEKVPKEFVNPITGTIAKTVPWVSGEARQYERLRRGVAGTLKTVVGETGVLTDYDIQRIIGILPSVTNTAKENELAINGINLFLKAKGIDIGDIAVNPEDVGDIQSFMTERGFAEDEVPIKPEVLGQIAGEEREVAEKTTPEEAKRLADRGFLESLVSLKGLKSFVGEAPGMAASAIGGTAQNIADLAKGDMESIKERNVYYKSENERIKNLYDAAATEITTKAEAYQILRSVYNLGKGAINKLKGTPPQDVKEVINQGKALADQGRAIRQQGLNTAQEAGQKIDGTTVFNEIKNYTDDATRLASPAQKKQMSNFLISAEKELNGKMINPDLAKLFWDIADDGHTTAGTAGKTIEAAYHRIVRDVIREHLDDVTQGAFEQGTALIHEGLSADRVLESLGRSIERKVAQQAIEGTPSAAMQFLKKYRYPLAILGGGLLGGRQVSKGLRTITGQ